MGGPVWIPKLYNGRNKTFFFGAYQGFRYSQTSDTPLKVPTAAQLAGDESSWPTQIYNPFTTRPDPANPGQYIRDPFPGNQIPSNLVDPRMTAYANFVFPAAGPVFDSNGDNAIDPTPLTQTQNEFDVRLDENLGSKNSVWFRYSFLNSLEKSSGGLPGLPATANIPARNYGGSFVHIFNPSLVLQVQAGHTSSALADSTRFTKPTAAAFGQIGFSTAFAGDFSQLPGGNLIPAPGIAGYSSGGEGASGASKQGGGTDLTTVGGTVTKLIGNHSFHFGSTFGWNYYHDINAGVSLTFAAQETGDTNPNDTVNSGDALASFVLNVPDSATRRNELELERLGGVWSAFAQDSWKATPRLTLNLGIRYDLTIPPPFGTKATAGLPGGIETGDMNFANGTYVLNYPSPACSTTQFAPCIPGGTLPDHVVQDPRNKIPFTNYNNVGPRVGFAYKLTDHIVIHGAYGIVYDNWAAVTQISQNISGSWPDIGQQLANNLNQPTSTSATPTVQAQNPFGGSNNSLYPTPTPFNQVQWFYDPHLKNPYSEQWNFGIQQELSPSTTMTLNYVGSGSHDLDVGGYYNTALTPGPGDPQSRSPYPYIVPTFYDRSIGSGNYNALQFSLDHRYNSGLGYQVAYTWSKTLDAGSDGWFGVEGGVPTDPYHIKANGSYSVAGYDLTNVLAVNTLYQVPVGKGKRFSTGNSIVDYVVGNWQFNNIFLAHSGLPYTVFVSSDIANTGNVGWVGYETMDLVGSPNLSKRTPAEWFNTAAYAVPAGYTYGDSGRHSQRQAASWNLDSSVFRQFPLGESRSFEFRAEAFNLFNNVIFGTPSADFNTGTSFGTINSTYNTARELQLGGKFIF